MRTGSGLVHEPGSSVRAGSAATLGGNPVRGSVSSDLVSGSVSDSSAGPVTSGQAVSGGGTVTDSKAGAVTKDVTSPIREGVAAPVQSTEGLRQQLRDIQPLPRDDTAAEGVPEDAVRADASENEEPEQPADQAPEAAEVPEPENAPEVIEQEAPPAPGAQPEEPETAPAEEQPAPEAPPPPEGEGQP